MDTAQSRLREIATQIVAERKASIRSHLQGSLDKDNDDMKSRDLLTRLMRANMAEDLPEDQRMSDEEIVSREYPDQIGRAHV